MIWQTAMDGGTTEKNLLNLSNPHLLLIYFDIGHAYIKRRGAYLGKIHECQCARSIHSGK